MEKSRVIEMVSRTLSDNEIGYEYERWSRDTLSGYYDISVSLLGKMLPNAFRRVEMVKLEPGEFQDIPAVIEIVSVPNQATPVKRDSRLNARAIPRLNCVTASADKSSYTMKSYEVLLGGGGMKVSPPVPENEEVYVSVLLDSPKKGEVDDEYVACVMEYMLYMSLMTDDESASSLTAAKMHYDNFVNSIKVMDAQVKSRERYVYGSDVDKRRVQ